MTVVSASALGSDSARLPHARQRLHTASTMGWHGPLRGTDAEVKQRVRGGHLRRQSTRSHVRREHYASLFVRLPRDGFFLGLFPAFSPYAGPLGDQYFNSDLRLCGMLPVLP